MKKTDILDGYIRIVEDNDLPADSVMVFRGHDVVAEHRWTPDIPHLIYSHTKSYASTAIGVWTTKSRAGSPTRCRMPAIPGRTSSRCDTC
jgi:hypothetical protein